MIHEPQDFLKNPKGVPQESVKNPLEFLRNPNESSGNHEELLMKTARVGTPGILKIPLGSLPIFLKRS